MVLDTSNAIDIPPLVSAYDNATGLNQTDPHGVSMLDRGAQKP